MLTLVQDFKKGELMLTEASAPSLKPGGILVRNSFSFISPGTEINTYRFAKKSLIGKALARKDLVAKVIDKVKREGIKTAFKAAMTRLEEPLPLGYSCAGTVEAVADDVSEFKKGDLVACAGTGYATHSEMIFVPKNLAAKVPDGVEMRDASSVALGAIAIQAYRIADLRLGESAAVLGLGTIGQILVQVLAGAGCRVYGYDPDGQCAANTAAAFNIKAVSEINELKNLIETQTGGNGVDSVIISASTQSNEPVELAPQLLRKRGSVVVLGVSGLDVPRKPYYEKELRLLFSTSYGPGRYDPQYEEYGRDYPLEYARWTEKRNMEAYLRMLSGGTIKLGISGDKIFPVEEGINVYKRLDSGELKSAVFSYRAEGEQPKSIIIPAHAPAPSKGRRFGIIGAGIFARNVLIPGLLGLNASPVILCTKTPAKGTVYAEKFGFQKATTDENEVFNEELDFIVIATPHSEHSRLLVKALERGTPAFCEKPLAIDTQGLQQAISSYESTRTPFMIGFNRRFSPAVNQMRNNLSKDSPSYISYLINAGETDKSSWIAQPQEGGRVLGEVCHFIDTCMYLTGSEIKDVFASSHPQKEVFNNCAANISFQDNSIAQILYSTCGNKSYMKERIEVHQGGEIAVLEDFRKLTLYGKNQQAKRFGAGSKGHREELAFFLKALDGKASLTENISASFNVTAAALALITSLRNNTPVSPDRITIKGNS